MQWSNPLLTFPTSEGGIADSHPDVLSRAHKSAVWLGRRARGWAGLSTSFGRGHTAITLSGSGSTVCKIKKLSGCKTPSQPPPDIGGGVNSPLPRCRGRGRGWGLPDYLLILLLRGIPGAHWALTLCVPRRRASQTDVPRRAWNEQVP